MDYHSFKKPVKGPGGKVKNRWYYYWTDEAGKQHQKVCKNCHNKSEVDNFIKSLPPLKIDTQNPLIRDIAAEMFIPGSDHADRRRQLGKSIEMETLVDARGYVEAIIAYWGDCPIFSIEPDAVIKYLFTVRRSGSWKNRYLSILKEVFLEAAQRGCKIAVPAFPTFARHSKKADIFTSQELSAFFKPGNFPNDQYFVFFLLTLSGGLRLGEARGVRAKQILFDKKILIVDGFCKKNGDRTKYNKKGTPENPKLRAVWLPDYTLGILSDYMAPQCLAPDDFIFTVNGHPLRQETAEMVFVRALVNAGIAHSKKKLIADGVWKKGKIVKKSEAIPGGRKLVPHSLRYTYVSRMRRELSAKDMMPMTGHVTEAQVDYYNRQGIEDILLSLPEADAALAGLLDFKSKPL